MGKIIKDTIHANGIDISVYSEDLQNDYISLTDIAKKREGEYPGYVIQNWLRNKSTVAFVGLWELIHNPNFNCVEFEAIKNESGLNRFASWISPEFKLYIIEDYQRLKEGENARLSLGWNLNRELSKLNYRIHTDAIKVNLIPAMLTPQQISYTYASEADLLNTVLFGKTAKEWRDSNPEEKGNIRDYATIHQLLVLANMESYNAILIKQGKTQAERMLLLHELAVQQMTTLSCLELSNLPGIEKK